mmetsp:Transcript_1164/g.3287  ORF Transcript_1164/g.3287 Transcript_1164/m.3287 type:complete len:279 (+) Transcript_1164:249-1085(+)
MGHTTDLAGLANAAGRSRHVGAASGRKRKLRRAALRKHLQNHEAQQKGPQVCARIARVAEAAACRLWSAKGNRYCAWLYTARFREPASCLVPGSDRAELRGLFVVARVAARACVESDCREPVLSRNVSWRVAYSRSNSGHFVRQSAQNEPLRARRVFCWAGRELDAARRRESSHVLPVLACRVGSAGTIHRCCWPAVQLHWTCLAHWPRIHVHHYSAARQAAQAADSNSAQECSNHRSPRQNDQRGAAGHQGGQILRMGAPVWSRGQQNSWQRAEELA